MGIEILKGLTLTGVRQVGEEEIRFESGNRVFRMLHFQECCECVYVEDVNGDFMDLVGTPILVAEEREEEMSDVDEWGTGTWTFYTLRTIKGSVDIRWNGTSNGYYSESVDVFEETRQKGLI